MRSKTGFSATGLLLALAVVTAVFGQSMSGGSRRSASTSTGTRENFQTSQFDFSISQPSLTAAAPLSGAMLPTDNSIDEKEYMIGSGDVFFVSVVESPHIRHTAAVDLSGRAFIPNIGLVEIGKVTYAEAKDIIAEYVASRLRNPSEVYVTLIQTKNATLSFTGNVRNPGSYEFPGSARLLDAIRMANDGDLPPPSNADLRRVMYTSGDSTTTYDLMAYLHKGDHTQNPYVYPGDRVRVFPTTNSIFISGALKSPTPGYYPLKDGETLGEFLSMFALDNTADTDNIIIFRAADNAKVTLSASDSAYVLSNLDVITVPVKKNHPGMHTVSVSGEIASPGHYPITENSTSAKQIIDMAGGIKENGNADQAVVIRPVRNLPERLNSGVPQLLAVRPERGASISMASASLDYTIIRLALYNAERVILEPGDQIFIPKNDSFVYISGNVKNPGAYPFRQGRDARYYVAQAGGFSGNANKSNVHVFMKYGDLVQNVEPDCIEPGSVIVVPTSVQYKFLTQVLLPVISTVATILMAGAVVYSNAR